MNKSSISIAHLLPRPYTLLIYATRIHVLGVTLKDPENLKYVHLSNDYDFHLRSKVLGLPRLGLTAKQ
jgi:hypothetical protein